MPLFFTPWGHRLACMKAIAVAKFKLGRDIRVPAIEEKVIANVNENIKLYFLKKEPIEKFFKSDIELSVAMQTAWHATWQSSAKSEINGIINSEFDAMINLASKLEINISNIDTKDHVTAILSIAREIIMHTNLTIIEHMKQTIEISGSFAELTKEKLCEVVNDFIDIKLIPDDILASLADLTHYHTYEGAKTYVPNYTNV